MTAVKAPEEFPLTFKRMTGPMPSFPQAQEEQETIGDISVNGVIIPRADILAEVQHHPADEPEQAINAAARALTVRQLLLQEAKRLEIQTEPESRAGGIIELDEDASIRGLLEQEVQIPNACEAECQRFYDNNTSKFTSDTIHEVKHILFTASPDDKQRRASAKAQSEQLIQHLKKTPTDFSAMAKSRSACPSREQGGKLGQLTPGSTVPEFESVLALMEEGELLETPVETRFGFHVVFLERRIRGDVLPFEFVRARIEGWLEASSWSRGVSQYLGILASSADIAGIEMASADGPLVQ